MAMELRLGRVVTAVAETQTGSKEDNGVEVSYFTLVSQNFYHLFIGYGASQNQYGPGQWGGNDNWGGNPQQGGGYGQGGWQQQSGGYQQSAPQGWGAGNQWKGGNNRY
jgi:hypothetical protein